MYSIFIFISDITIKSFVWFLFLCVTNLCKSLLLYYIILPLLLYLLYFSCDFLIITIYNCSFVVTKKPCGFAKLCLTMGIIPMGIYRRVSVIRGQVLSADGLGIVGIRVSVDKSSRFGFTLTRKGGWYDEQIQNNYIRTFKKPNYSFMGLAATHVVANLCAHHICVLRV